MGESKINRQRLEETDFPILEKMTLELKKKVLDSFPLQSIDDLNWPFRYQYNHSEDFSFEFIFSSMGSFTVRISKSDRYRRNPPPIFYLSIGKYSDTEYTWEDLNADSFSINEESLKSGIYDAIGKFSNSIVQ